MTSTFIGDRGETSILVPFRVFVKARGPCASKYKPLLNILKNDMTIFR